MNVREAIALQALIESELRDVATALDVLRRTDSAADAAWKGHEHARLHRCEQVVKRLHTAGGLAPVTGRGNGSPIRTRGPRCVRQGSARRITAAKFIDGGV